MEMVDHGFPTIMLDDFLARATAMLDENGGVFVIVHDGVREGNRVAHFTETTYGVPLFVNVIPMRRLDEGAHARIQEFMESANFRGDLRASECGVFELAQTKAFAFARVNSNIARVV